MQPISFVKERQSDGGHDGEAVTVEQYLSTMYHPDCDYIDGHLEERNLGEFDHNRIQKRLLVFFTQKEAEWDVECIQEQRLQVSAKNYRVPDFMVLSGTFYQEQIVRTAPILIVEVLSPEDTLKRLLRKVKDYVAIGIQHIWVFDPDTRVAYRGDAAGFHIVTEDELTVPNTPIRLKLTDIFSALDR